MIPDKPIGNEKYQVNSRNVETIIPIKKSI